MTPQAYNDTFYELIENTHIAMLVTRTPDDELRARPMAIADVDRDGGIWLITRKSAAKVDEIHEVPQVGLTIQDGDHTFVSVSGIAQVIDDREMAREHGAMKLAERAPIDLEPEEVAMVRITPQTGELWQGDDSLLAPLKRTLRAWVGDDETAIAEMTHAKVSA